MSDMTRMKPSSSAHVQLNEIKDDHHHHVSVELAADAAMDPHNHNNATIATGIKTEEEEVAFHHLSLDQVAAKLQSDVDFQAPYKSRGLTSADAAARLLQYGENNLTPPKETPLFVKYLLHYLDPLHVLLLLSGILSCIAYGLDTTIPLNLWLGLVLFGATFVSATFAFIQEGRATAVMKSFRNLLPRKAHVIRDGAELWLESSKIVIGDVVRVGTGDQVPADIRLIHAADVKVELASLTGESLPVSLSVQHNDSNISEHDTGVPRLEDSRCVAFNTTLCLEGEMIGIVFATGDHSMIGKIAALASRVDIGLTPLQLEMKFFVRRLLIFAIVLGTIFFIISQARGQYNFINGLINVFVVVLVACVPQGLPVTVVSCLALTAKRMAEKHVFVKTLQSVETLGSATVIASDKTGTITINKMSVSRLWFDQTAYTVESIIRDWPHRLLNQYSSSNNSSNNSNKPIAKEGSEEHKENSADATLLQLERIAGVCNRAKYEDEHTLTEEQAEMMETAQAINELDPNMTLHTAKRNFPEFLVRIDSSLSVSKAKQQYGSALLFPDQDKKRAVIGDASDTALFNFLKDRQQSIELLRFRNQKVFEQPFNSKTKFAITIVQRKPRKTDLFASSGAAFSSSSSLTLLMKGAPEIVLSKCTHYMYRGIRIPIDDTFRGAFQQAYEFFGGLGERVLGFASVELDAKEVPIDDRGRFYQDKDKSGDNNNNPFANAINNHSNDLTFIGLMSLVDPPKPAVAPAVAQCRSAGIKVIMITGDHPLTATAIARQVGIISGPTRGQLALLKNIAESDVPEEEIKAEVVTGADIPNLTEADWNRILGKAEIVFARTTPTQKLKIVEELQKRNEVVAVTGDGVNDSPALKKADIGVAMGIMGSDVARDAADVVLMDDNFASLVLGVEMGRTIFDNLMKTIAYTLTHLIPETLPVLFYLCFGLPNAITSLQILCIDLGTELAPAISLAYEKAESNVMKRNPRNSQTDRLVNQSMVLHVFVIGCVQTAVGLLAFFLVFDYYGFTPSMLYKTDAYWVSGSDPILNKYGQVFNDSAQVDIVAQAQTAFWLMLTGSQVIHIFLAKTRYAAVLSHGFFDNIVMNYGVLVEMFLMAILIFIPAVQAFFGTNTFPGKYWAILTLSWGLMILFIEGKKYLYRNYPRFRYRKWLAW